MTSTSPTPLLILSDAISSSTGLARIARDLATRIHQTLPQFRVATAGIGAPASRAYPWPQYTLTTLGPGMTPVELPAIWRDFAGAERGAVLAIWNPSWLAWQQAPEFASLACSWWLYAPVDGHTPSGSLPALDCCIMARFDRVLAYTEYGARLIDAGLVGADEARAGDATAAAVAATTAADSPAAATLSATPHLPHGMDSSLWQRLRYPRAKARATFRQRLTGNPSAPGIKPETLLLACVATNSARKDWGLALQTLRVLADRGHAAVLWAHTDKPSSRAASGACWDIPALASDLNVLDRLILSSGTLPDSTLAWLYAAADCTLAIGAGEGWGYSAAESLALGVPVVHNNYAGGANFVPPEFLVQPAAFRVEPNSGLLRPVGDPGAWATAVEQATISRAAAKLPEYIWWEQAWPRWQEWLLAGLPSSSSSSSSTAAPGASNLSSSTQEIK